MDSDASLKLYYTHVLYIIEQDGYDEVLFEMKGDILAKSLNDVLSRIEDMIGLKNFNHITYLDITPRQ